MKSNYLIHSTLILSQFILIIHSFVVKHALDSTTKLNSIHTPLAFASIRSFISAPILLLFYYIQTNRTTSRTTSITTSSITSSKKSHTTQDYISAIYCGFLGVFLYPLLYALGLRSTTPTAACVCEALTPIFSVLLEYYLNTSTKQERNSSSSGSSISNKKILAVLLAVSGSIIMTIQGAWMDTNAKGGNINDLSNQVSGRLTGNLLVISSAAAYALFLSIQRKQMSDKTNGPSVLFLTAWGNVFGAMMLIGLAYCMGALDMTELSTNYSSHFWYGLLWAALVTSVLGYTLEGLANSWR